MTRDSALSARFLAATVTPSSQKRIDSLARDRAKVSKSKGKREENDATAGLVGLTDRGTLAPGKRADLLVLDANPLDDIRNTRRIAKFYLAGVEVDRARP